MCSKSLQFFRTDLFRCFWYALCICSLKLQPIDFNNPNQICSECDSSCGQHSCLNPAYSNTCLYCPDNQPKVLSGTAVFSTRGYEIPLFTCTTPTKPTYDTRLGYLAYCIPECGSCKYFPTKCTSCSDPSKYLYDIGRCMSDCPSDEYEVIVEGNVRRCTRKKDSYAQGISILNRISSFFVPISAAANQLNRPGVSSVIVKSLYLNMLIYLRYVDLQFPEKLLQLFDSAEFQLISFNFMPEFPNSWKNEADQYPAPLRYRKYGVDGLFIVNFWSFLLIWVVLLVGCIVVALLSRMKIENTKGKKLIKLISNFIFWNYIVSFFMSSLGDITLFMIIEYQSLEFGDGRPLLTLIFSLILNFACLLSTIGLFLLCVFPNLRKLYKEFKEGDPKEVSPLAEKFQVLYEDFKTKSSLRYHFLQF